MKYNNAESTLSADITASGTSIVLKTGEGALFPSTGYPEKMKIEHFEGGVVTKREVITISWRTGDILTISSRASEACVQDESLTTKTRTQNAFSFSSGDTISMTITEEDYNGIIETLNTTIPNTYATKDEVKKSELVYGASSTWTDDYAITVSWITAYQDWMTFRVKADVANTWAATLNVNSIWAKAVKKNQGTVDLEDGDWAANWIATLVYNSTLDVFQYSSQEANIVSFSWKTLEINLTAWEAITDKDRLHFSGDGQVYVASTDNQNFVWFANGSFTTWQSVIVQYFGKIEWLSWLTILSKYYFQADWTIWTTEVVWKEIWYALSATELLLTENLYPVADSIVSHPTLTNNLIASYQFENDVLDSTANNYHWTNNGTTDTLGKIGRGRNLDWLNDYIQLPQAVLTQLISSDAFSFSVWLNWDSFDDLILVGWTWWTFLWNAIWFWTNSSSQARLFVWYSGSSPQAIWTTVLSPWTFYHIVWTYDGTNLKIYVNGNLEDTTSAPSPTWGTNNDFYVWRYQTTYLDWVLDELLIWDRDLNWTEVVDLYNNWDWLRYS